VAAAEFLYLGVGKGEGAGRFALRAIRTDGLGDNALQRELSPNHLAGLHLCGAGREQGADEHECGASAEGCRLLP
jgi:hypothetical protein